MRGLVPWIVAFASALGLGLAAPYLLDPYVHTIVIFRDVEIGQLRVVYRPPAAS